MDVSMVFTPAFRYVQNRETFNGGVFGSARERTGNDFDIVWREAYLEMANVFKSAPEITFWGGQRFYDRFNFDPQDYFWLDMSGYGAGVKNIDVGISKLWLAYLGGLDNDINSPNTGSFYKHSLDVRLKDIPIGPGKLMLFGIGNYEKGATFNVDFAGNTLTNPVRRQPVSWSMPERRSKKSVPTEPVQYSSGIRNRASRWRSGDSGTKTRPVFGWKKVS
jgi:LamB porin